MAGITIVNKNPSISVITLNKRVSTLVQINVSGFQLKFVGVYTPEKHLSNCWQLLCETHLIFQICLATVSSPLSLPLWEGFLIVCVSTCMCMYIWQNQPQAPQPSLYNKEVWWFSQQPHLLSHTLINNYTDSLPCPGGEKERKEPFRQLLSSHAF